MHLRFLVVCLFTFVVACGGGESPPNTGNPDLVPQTAQEMVQSCFSSDLGEFADLLGFLQGILEEGAAQPGIQVDWLSGLLGGGIFPWSIDLDADGSADLTGNLKFTNADGAVTIPFDVSSLPDLNDPESLDIAELLGAIRDGTTVHLHFEFENLLLDSGFAGSGDGDLRMQIDGGAVVAGSGEGTFETGPCALDFEFDMDDLNGLELGAWPVAEIGFELESRGVKMNGSVELDGTDVAKVRAALPGEPVETFEVDLGGDP